jgi:(+)-neomenthol dehydrogenase
VTTNQAKLDSSPVAWRVISLLPRLRFKYKICSRSRGGLVFLQGTASIALKRGVPHWVVRELLVLPYYMMEGDLPTPANARYVHLTYMHPRVRSGSQWRELPVNQSCASAVCYWLHRSARVVAVVTGGNKGIGLEVCRQLACSGVTVVLTARDDARGAAAVENLRGLGLSDVLFHRLDVTDAPSIARLAGFLETRFGKLDILVITEPSSVINFRRLKILSGYIVG